MALIWQRSLILGTIDRTSATKSNRRDTLERIRSSGLKLIFERGYEGVGLRALAAEAGIGQSTLYEHYSNKQQLVVDLIDLHMRALLDSLHSDVPDDTPPLARFVVFERFHLLYHMRRRREVFICYSELRSLEPDNYEHVTALRKDYEHVLIGILQKGMAEGVFRTGSPRVAAYALLSMLSGVTAWYDPAGPVSEEDVCSAYTQLALAAVVDPLAAVVNTLS